MQLADFLDFESIRVGLSSGNKRKLLQMLGQMAGARLGYDPATIVDTVLSAACQHVNQTTSAVLARRSTVRPPPSVAARPSKVRNGQA